MAYFALNTIISSRDILEGPVTNDVEETFSNLEKIITDGYNDLKQLEPQERQILNTYQKNKSDCEMALAVVNYKIQELQTRKRELQSSLIKSEGESRVSIVRSIASVTREIGNLERERGRLNNNIRIYTEIIKLQQDYLTMISNGLRFYSNAYNEFHRAKQFVDERNKELIKELNDVIEILKDYFSAPSRLGITYLPSSPLKIENEVLIKEHKNAVNKLEEIDKIKNRLSLVDNQIYAHQDNIFDQVHETSQKQIKIADDFMKFLEELSNVTIYMYEYLEKYDAYAKREVKSINLKKKGFLSTDDTSIIEGVGILAWLLISKIK